MRKTRPGRRSAKTSAARSRKTTRARTNGTSSALSKLSTAGVEYLKCALAAPDFSVTAFAGIPDSYSGRVISKRYETTASIGNYGVAGQDLYLMSSNCPGVAFFYMNRPAGGIGPAAWVAVEYPDTNTLFPLGTQDLNVQRFRFASSQIELVCTANAMTWTGSIQVLRGMVTAAEVNVPVSGAAGGTAIRWALTGTTCVNSVKPEVVLPFNKGAYAVARTTDSSYGWSDVSTVMEFNQLYEGSSIFLTSGVAGAQLVGFGNMETVIYKIPGFSVAGNSAILRAWACLEYQVSSTSALYDYTHMSPPEDPLALQLMREYAKVMPPAVKFGDNANFWQAFLLWAGRIAVAVAPVVSIANPLAGKLVGVGGRLATSMSEFT